MRKVRFRALKIILSSPTLKGSEARTAEGLDALCVHVGVPWPQVWCDQRSTHPTAHRPLEQKGHSGLCGFGKPPAANQVLS